jgi:hypothetical protein
MSENTVNNYAKAKERKRLESQQGKRDKFEKTTMKEIFPTFFSVSHMAEMDAEATDCKKDGNP